MPKIKIALLALLAAASFSPAHAASFDCAKTATQSGKLICGDKDLSAADDKMNGLLQADMAPLSDAGKQTMLKSQADWYQYIDAACMRVQPVPDVRDSGPVPCLKEEYRARITQLTDATIKTDDYTIMRVDQFGGRASTEQRGPFPGIVTTKLAYPQFDQPGNATQEAWNQYIAAQANERRRVPQDPDTTDVVIDYAPPVVGSKLIATTIKFSYFTHGGAHSFGGTAISTWLTDENRPLKVEDVFSTKKDWKPAVARICFDALKTKAQAEHQTFDVDDPAKLEDKVGDPYRWSFAPEGLGIQFNYYEVGPRTIGAPKITVPWEKLKPYLADDASDLIPKAD